MRKKKPDKKKKPDEKKPDNGEPKSGGGEEVDEEEEEKTIVNQNIIEDKVFSKTEDGYQLKYGNNLLNFTNEDIKTEIGYIKQLGQLRNGFSTFNLLANKLFDEKRIVDLTNQYNSSFKKCENNKYEELTFIEKIALVATYKQCREVQRNSKPTKGTFLTNFINKIGKQLAPIPIFPGPSNE